MASEKTNTLEIGQTIAGFRLIDTEEIPEIDGCAYVFTHEKTQARLMWLATDDINKTFSIAFKTPPKDDTGVFHILEHSVLCGSDKFPVKEPFVNLIKTSMATFLNAFTFVDKTMYPLASTNTQDFENLMDVYLDAVLHPAIYHKKEIFEQEGWHYELADKNDKLSYNGVVFNEMKGALSDPDEVLLENLNRSLFPDSAYRFESGGDPVYIPELSYEEFLDEHARHYRLDNSYTILYGDLDIARELAFINERFCQAEIRSNEAPNELILQKPLIADDMCIEMKTAQQNACVGVGYVVGHAHDRERILAISILLDTLIGSNEAPLKKALLNADLGDDVRGYFVGEDAQLQPALIFQLKGAHKNSAKIFQDTLENTCKTLAQQGIDHDKLRASLAQAEFNLREADYGYPDGIALSINALSSWLYDDDDPYSYLHYEKALDHIRTQIDDGYFEDLLNEIICTSQHKACVEIVASDNDDTALQTQKLAAYKASLSNTQVDELVAHTQALYEAQNTPDTPEALATLPLLTRDDIDTTPKQVPCKPYDKAPVTCMHYPLETHKIAYVYHYFDMDHISWEDLPYVSILANLLGQLATDTHDASELDTLIETKLGNFTTTVDVTTVDVYSPDDTHANVCAKFVIAAASLYENVVDLACIPVEVFSQTRFDDKTRIQKLLQQMQIRLEQSLSESGHTHALLRAQAHYSATAALREHIGGCSFYTFLRDLNTHFDERFDELCDKLTELRMRIFKKDTLQTSFCGEDRELQAFWNAFAMPKQKEDEHIQTKLQAHMLAAPSAEGFAIPTNICFSALACACPDNPTYNGLWNVASHIFSYDYLWNTVRVQGGAYGCSFQINPQMIYGMTSYRDPSCDKTLDFYRDINTWLTTWQPTQQEFESFVVATVAEFDAPKKAPALVRRCDLIRFAGRKADWWQQCRQEALHATLENVKSLDVNCFAHPEQCSICVLGPSEMLHASKYQLSIDEFLTIRQN